MSILEHDNTDLTPDAIADQDAADAAALANVPSISSYDTDDMQFTPAEAFKALSALAIIGFALIGSPAFAFTPPPENPAPLVTQGAGARMKSCASGGFCPSPERGTHSGGTFTSGAKNEPTRRRIRDPKRRGRPYRTVAGGSR